MTRAEAAVFDIGNVLIEWRPERFYDGVIGPEARAALFAGVDLHAMNERIDRGEDFRATVEETAAAHPRWAAEIRLWRARWPEIAAPAIPGSVAILKALRKRGVPVFALSNIGVETFALARARYPFLGLFDRAWLSGAMGATKPAPRIYEMAEADCGLPPQALILADDRADNIAAAATRGWRTHLFEGPEGWAGALVAAGLLDEREIRP